ncbi:permease [bacterium]|nr:permease [bacterium]
MTEHCEHHDSLSGHCHSEEKWDWLYWSSFTVIAIVYLSHLLDFDGGLEAFKTFQHKTYELMNSMWWGMAISIFAVGALSKVPREMVMTYFGSRSRLGGLLKATMAGTLFDLCNHGILILGMKIYERGASLGQTMAFLIASPWNSFSLTMILYALVGGELTFYFLIFSIIVAVLTGWIFDELVERKMLPQNPYSFRGSEFQPQPFKIQFSFSYLLQIIKTGFQESKMILKWIFVGTILSAAVATFVPQQIFVEYFGPTLKGLFATLLAATGLEVCSEGSVPLAADLVNVAKAPGNAFVFLMAGVATDFTEFMAIRTTMKSWKIALLVPLLTVPQILIFGWLMNVWMQGN